MEYRDVVVDIDFCGVCHGDLHQVRDEWGTSTFPLVRGYEIIARVRTVSANVRGFRPGDRAGVGFMVDACRRCASCHEGFEQYCQHGFVPTSNVIGCDGLPTYGGYSTDIVVDQRFLLHVSERRDPAAASP
jgi:alcohol dehydrogenase (NADP+)